MSEENLNLKSSIGWLEMINYTSAPTDVDTSRRGLAFVGGALRYYNGSTFVAVGGSGGASTWDELYDADKTLTIDDTTLTFQVTKAGIAGLTLAGNGTATGALLAFSNSGSGADVLGTSSTWQVSKAGTGTFAALIGESLTGAANLVLNATSAGTIAIGSVSTGTVTITPALVAVASVTITGVADTNCFVLTAGDAVITNGKITATNDDTDAIMTLTANAVTSGNAILLTANGVTSGSLVKLVTTSAGFSGGFFIECNDGSDRFTVGVDGATTITSAVASTAALAVTGVQTSEDMVAFSSNGVTATAHGTLKVTAAGATAAGSAVLLVTHTGTPADSTSYLAVFDYETATEATNDPISVEIRGGTSVGACLNLISKATTITGGILNFTNVEMTTGVGINMVGMDALTTGQGISLAHSTTVIADGGSMLRIASSGINTGGATNGTMLDIQGSGQIAGIENRFDSVMETGTVMSVIGTAVMTTTGNLLTLTANAATTAAGILRVNANGLTSGIGFVIASSSTGLTGAGRLLSVVHSGNAGDASGVVAEISSAAADETVVLQVKNSALFTGNLAVFDMTASAAGTGIYISATEGTLTSGKYFVCYDGAANDFSIAKYGATVIAGNALGTAALTLTAGDILVSAGNITGAGKIIFSGIETIAAGNPGELSLTKTLHSLDADAGGDTFTLADGIIGQIMVVTCLSATGIVTVTPANMSGGTSVTINAAGDTAILMFVDTEWYVIGGNGYTIV